MNKRELIDKLSQRLHTPKSRCEDYLNAHIAILGDELENGGEIMLQGFGSFSPWPQTERPGRNPRNGEACLIRPRTSVKFRPGKLLLEQLNGAEQEDNFVSAQ